MSASPTRHDEGGQTTPAYGPIDDLDLTGTVAQVLDHWPCAGMAVAVIRDGALAWFHGHGLADVAAKRPITEDTVFRVASITKTFTAIAVMQLWEQGLGGPRCARQRLPPHIPAGPGEAEPVARHRAAPPHAYRRRWLLAAVVGPASAGRRYG